jgi:hypothetical protein
LGLDPKGRLLSTGDDGFLEIWDLASKTALERFAVSPYAVSAMAARPGETQAAFVDRDPSGMYRIAVWDYAAKERLFIRRFRTPVVHLAYSASGSFLIAAWGGAGGIAFLGPESGEDLPTPEVSGPVSLALTGRSERSMLVYQSDGAISYWDLGSGRLIERLSAPPRLRSPIVFGSNRFLGGLDQGGLVILDAVSGAVLFRERLAVQTGILTAVSPEGLECVYFAPDSQGAAAYRFGISAEGRLELLNRLPFPPGFPSLSSALITAGGAALGAADGGVWFGSLSVAPALLEAVRPVKLAEIAVSGSTLAFLTAGGALGLMPLDYRLLSPESLSLEQGAAYTALAGGGAEEEETRFILWRNDAARTAPLIRLKQAGGAWIDELRVDLPSRAPLIQAGLSGGKALFLDAAGTITVVSTQSGAALFAFAVSGAMDAVFADPDSLLIGRSAVSGDAAFLAIDINTGETVPIAYPSAVGVKVYAGADGARYGAALGQNADGLSTVFIRLDPEDPQRSTLLYEASGEHTRFDIAESAGVPATTLGGEGALQCAGPAPRPLERAGGFPHRLINGGACLISLDSEGAVSWHDPASGKLLALFRLYPDNTFLLTHPWLCAQAPRSFNAPLAIRSSAAPAPPTRPGYALKRRARLRRKAHPLTRQAAPGEPLKRRARLRRKTHPLTRPRPYPASPAPSRARPAKPPLGMRSCVAPALVAPA